LIRLISYFLIHLLHLELESRTYYVSNEKINVEASINSLATSYLEGYRIFYAMTESHIAYSWMSEDSLQFVQRSISPMPDGNQFIFAEPPTAGKTFTDKAEFTLPENVKLKNCQVIAFIQNINTKKVMAVTAGLQVENQNPAFAFTMADSVISGNGMEELIFSGMIQNNTDSELTVIVKRDSVHTPEGWTSSICLDACLPAWIDFSEATIPAMESTKVSLHVFTGATPDTGMFSLRLSSSETVITKTLTAQSDWPVGVAHHKDNLSFELVGAYPNPFNPSTAIEYSLADNCSSVKLQVFSVLGRQVAERELSGQSAGLHFINFDANTLAGGVYLYRIVYQSGAGLNSTGFKKFTLLK
jgi:hypothetical protein